MRALRFLVFFDMAYKGSNDVAPIGVANHTCCRQRARLSLYGVPFASVFAHTYALPLYVPPAPSGVQNEPGRTVGADGVPPCASVVVEATVVAVVLGSVVVARGVVEAIVVVVLGSVVALEIVVALGSVVVTDTATGVATQPRVVVPTHWPLSKFLARPHSL